MEKLSKTKEWMRDHPHDTPCPSNASAARVWRIKRGIEVTPRHAALLAKYEEAMAAKRAAAAQMSEQY